MKRLGGPDLKMPDLKPPAFLADFYYDLRDRRLLPLVALIVVAIAAVPFLLGGDSEALPEGGAAAEAGVVGAGGAGVANLTVVEARPGLRDYRKRLRRLAPSNPFKQQYAPPPAGAAQDAGEGAGSSAALPEAGTTEADETNGTPPGTGNTGGGAPGEIDPDDPGLRFYAFRPEIRFGVAGSGDLKSYDELPLGQTLPKRNPVIVFIGASENGKRVAFDVSPEVAMVKGPGRCIGGPQSCSLLILEAGQAADIVTGKPNRDFRLKIVQIQFVEVQRPQPASSSSASTQPWGFDLSQNFSK